MKNVEKVPKYVLANLGLQTQRQYKQQKRWELAMVIKALDTYRLSCSWCPDYRVIKDIDEELDTLKKSHSVEQWGR